MSRIAFREHAHKGQIPGVKNQVGKFSKVQLKSIYIDNKNLKYMRVENMNDYQVLI